LMLLYASAPAAEVRLLLGQCLWNTGDAAGVAALVDTIADGALDPRERMLALQADRRLGRPDRALAYVAAGDDGVDGVALTADHAWALVAEICLAAGHAPEALAAIDRAVARAPRRAVHHHNRAAILVALGRQDEARAALDRARALDPGLGR
jgi:tetratricopeptide (TPR) repeat protein